jgi:hypothetical protein
MDENAARAIAKAAVQETFLALGVDASTPAGILEAQAGFSMLRTAVRVRGRVIMAVAALAGSGIGYALWEAVLRAKAGQ